MASPMARLQQKSRRQSPQVVPDQPAFPARWFYDLYRALPGDHAWLPPSSARRLSIFANLTPASERQDHTTSPSASATFVRRALRVHRIPASRFVTIGRSVPLHRGGMRESMVLICPTRQARRPATDWHDGQFVHGGMREVRVGWVHEALVGRADRDPPSWSPRWRITPEPVIGPRFCADPVGFDPPCTLLGVWRHSNGVEWRDGPNRREPPNPTGPLERQKPCQVLRPVRGAPAKRIARIQLRKATRSP
jgi:hypothetical protein